MAADDRVLIVNGGSSSIKFAIFRGSESPERLLSGQIERIGQPGAVLTASTPDQIAPFSMTIDAADHRGAAGKLIDWIETSQAGPRFAAIGHRVVHGGLHLNEHQLVTPELIAELRKTQCLDLTHLPREIMLIEEFQARFPSVKQVACFDTAFHRGLPRIAQLLPIPRRYFEAGVRRIGFHGLSYTYLMQELYRIAGEAANGRVILAHLGSGSSMAALYAGQPVDTTMAFTPAAGLMMGTRPGDLDPGLLVYLMRVEKLTAEELDHFVSHLCGLTGISDGISDVRELTSRRAADPHAAEALDLYCRQAKKWLGAYAAVLGGVETVVFSGGIGEHSAAIRSGICEGLEYLGLRLDAGRNASSSAVISAADSRVTVRVIPADEESVMAGIVFKVTMSGKDSNSLRRNIDG
jgi:acetate kinase